MSDARMLRESFESLLELIQDTLGAVRVKALGDELHDAPETLGCLGGETIGSPHPPFLRGFLGLPGPRNECRTSAITCLPSVSSPRFACATPSATAL